MVYPVARLSYSDLPGGELLSAAGWRAHQLMIREALRRNGA